jgi:hypothetical protein
MDDVPLRQKVCRTCVALFAIRPSCDYGEGTGSGITWKGLPRRSCERPSVDPRSSEGGGLRRRSRRSVASNRRAIHGGTTYPSRASLPCRSAALPPPREGRSADLPASARSCPKPSYGEASPQFPRRTGERRRAMARYGTRRAAASWARSVRGGLGGARVAESETWTQDGRPGLEARGCGLPVHGVGMGAERVAPGSSGGVPGAAAAPGCRDPGYPAPFARR